jgi:hypothetical protein
VYNGRQQRFSVDPMSSDACAPTWFGRRNPVVVQIRQRVGEVR